MEQSKRTVKAVPDGVVRGCLHDRDVKKPIEDFFYR